MLNTGLDELIGSETTSRKHLKSKSGISFVYLDINGCLVQFYHQAFTKVSAEANQPVDLVETAFWHYNDQVCRGEITMAEFNQLVGKRLDMPNFNWENYYLAATKPMPKMHELVDWISKHYGIGLLTNIMPGLVDEMKRRKFIPDINYDTIIDSSRVHLIKPERKIYELAQKEAKCPANEILFVDDSRANLMAAEKLGWHVLWFDDTSSDESISHIREALELAQSS